MNRVCELVLRYGWNSTAFQILNPGIAHWFSPHTDAVVGYVTAGAFWVVAGEPVCADEQLCDVVAQFEADAQKVGKRVCYFGAQERLATHLATCNNTSTRMLLGAQPVWHPAHWGDIVRHKASLRAQLSRARNKHVVVSQWHSHTATNNPRLMRCLDEWLQTRGLPPLHFLVEPNTLGWLEHRRVFVAERNQQTIGFLVASPVPLRNGWLIEQIVRCVAAPNGTAELLIDAAMHALHAAGATYVSFGLSPLSRRAGIPCLNQSVWVRLLLFWMREHGRRFYNFDGLDAFKAKLLPNTWEPLYAITNEPKVTPATFYAIAGAFSGMSPVSFVVLGLSRAVWQELYWLHQRVCHVEMFR